MRIGMIAPLEMRVQPPGYGGTELVASLLTEGLVRRGHDVTLFASGDSVTAARLVAGCDRFLRGAERDKGILTMLNVTACLERGDEFDLIHNHTCSEGLATAGLVRTPMLTTLHGGLNGTRARSPATRAALPSRAMQRDARLSPSAIRIPHVLPRLRRELRSFAPGARRPIAGTVGAFGDE
jgi:hypothetical protein